MFLRNSQNRRGNRGGHQRTCLCKPLAARRYNVTVYEKTDRLGGSLWERFPDGSFWMKSCSSLPILICRFLISSAVRSRTGHICGCGLCGDGAGGDDFGGPGDGVFIGGGITGADLPHALKQGIDAAN
jgi:hypothetical protein